MAEIIDDVIHLTQEIGPHPAGTEEEQQAALYLAGELQKESDFTPVIEDFQCVTNDQIPRLVCFGLALVAVIVSIVFPVAAIPCFLLVALAAVVFVLEILGKPVISRLLRTGASQNVVAKYQPSAAGGVARRRKVILVANYDSGKVLKPEQSPIAAFLPIMQKVTAVALIVAAVLLLFRATFFAADTGAVSSLLTMLLVICAILFVLPIVRSVLHMVAPFSHSANNNASGVAVLLDVARQVGTGLVSNEEVIERGAREGNQVHGEAAARAAGAVPEGATIEYEAEMSPQESLAAAKAAIAALTGKPVADKVPVTDISSRLVKGGGLEVEDEEAISSVRFEVSDTPPVREKTSHFRTMVDDGFEDYDNTPSAQIEREQLSRQEAEEAEREAVRAKEEESQRAAQQVAQEATTAVTTESFERPAPMSVVNGFQSAPVDKTPAWAKTAQAKARANKPEDSQSHRVSRSRYADTVAAHLTEAATRNQNNFAPQAEVVQEAAPEVEDSALASRLAALRSEIESTEAPHISHETQAVLDNMEAADELPQGTTEFAAIDAVALASSIDETALQAAPMGAVSHETSSTDAVSQDVQTAVTAPQAPVSAAVETAGSLATAEADDAIDEGSSLANCASAMRSATSRSARKVAGASHAFASRLKSIASQKANGVAEDGAVDIADEVLPQLQNGAGAQEDAEVQPSAQPVRLREVRTANNQEAALEDAAAQQDENLEEAPAQAPSAVKPSAPSSATAAISPIDVSRFMNKEALEDESLDQEDLSFDADPMYDDSFDDAAFSQAAIDQQLSTEETQRVSSERIQEAIQEASMYTPVLDDLRSADVDGQQVASPIMGMEEMLPQIPLDAPEQEASAKRQVIVLPDVVAPHAGATEGTKQRAPMADANEDTKAGSKTLLSNMLPRIGDAPSSDATDDEPVDRFGLDLPALGETNQSNSAVSVTGSFATVGGTGSFAPVGDELVADVDPEERYIDDADDSAYDEEYTETGAFAGQGYVEMPKSRAGRLFGRFRSKKKKAAQEEMSVSEWVDVDESYNARSVGKERGDWSSFRQDEEIEGAQSNAADDGFVDIDYRETSFDNRRGWNGGAFSLSRLKKSAQRDPEDIEQPIDEMLDDEAYLEEDVLVDVNPAVRIDGNVDTAEQINRELRKLQDFRHPDIDTEVWFVALGAEQYSHSGMQAFLDEHADEMKGAVIINLEALGAGSLSSIEREGVYKSYKPSSRTKRFIRQAIERSGVACRSAVITRRETPASIAMSRGVQALTIAGMAEDDTALHSADNDILENIDEDMLKDASKFVLSILKSI